MRRRCSRRGYVLALTVFALMVILGAAALTMDVGLLTAGAQRAQEVADAAAHGAGMCLPDATTGRITAHSLVLANNAADSGLQAVVESYVTSWDGTPAAGPDVVFYGPWDYVPDFGLLGQYARAVRVTAHVPVQFTFAKLLGFEGANPTRSCTVVRMPIGGVPICPMWISYEQDYLYGQSQQLLMADDPACANIPGSFGWLNPPSGDSNTFLELLSGYNLPESMLEDNWVQIGDTVNAYTGLSVGQWAKALNTAPDGLARMDRSQWAPWTYDTFYDYHNDNPRILIIPLVEYIGGTGSGAQFLIHKFGAFYVESINSKKTPYSIIGRFIQYTTPGIGGDPFADDTGIWTVNMVG